jgi:membrane fusion protein (multidrug efflux system)
VIAVSRPPQSPAHVEMAKMESYASTRTVSLAAELAPFLQTDIEAGSPGYVEKVLVDRGCPVHRGQLLVQLSAPEINSQTSASEANLHQAEADVAQADAQAAAAEATTAKLQEAAKTPGAAAGNELLQPKSSGMRRRLRSIAGRLRYGPLKTVSKRVRRRSIISA